MQHSGLHFEEEVLKKVLLRVLYPSGGNAPSPLLEVVIFVVVIFVCLFMRLSFLVDFHILFFNC